MTRRAGRSACDVALFLPTLGGGGAERVTINLARGLIDSGAEVDLLVANMTGAYASGLPEGIRLIDLKAGRVVAAVPAIVRYLRKERPRSLLSAMNHANVAAIWAKQISKFQGRTVVVEHNDLVQAGSGSFLEGKVIPYLVSHWYPRASSIVAVSEGVKASLVRGAGLRAEIVKVIYNPVLTDDIASKARERVDHPFLQEGGPPVVLGVGRLTAQKNFGNMISAFARICQVRDARLVVLGEGEKRGELEQQVEQLGLADKVSFPGFVDNPFAFLARANVFVLSSEYEGLPTVLIEALAVGTRVVATDCPSGPREILAGGRFGRLVPVGDPAALADSVLSALSEPTPELGDWLEQFTTEHASRRYLTELGLA